MIKAEFLSALRSGLAGMAGHRALKIAEQA